MSNFRAKGLETFFDVLDIIKDPKKFQEYVEALQEETRKYKEVVEAVVELSKVNEYTMNIREREELSKTALQDAKAQVKALLEKTQAQVEKRQEAVAEKEQVLANKEASLATLSKELADKNAQLASQQVELEKQRESLASRTEAVQKLQAELDEKLAKLRALV